MKTPITYTQHAIESLEQFMADTFNHAAATAGPVFHEMESDYVHSDVYTYCPAPGTYALITGGMGARAMEVPFPSIPAHCELVMYLSDSEVLHSPTGLAVANQLMSASKYPFREEQWFGNAHTIDTAAIFYDTFGYDYVAFWDRGIVWTNPDTGDKVHFFYLVPLYEEERDWCVYHHALALMEELYNRYGDAIFRADFKREVCIPDLDEEEIYAYKMMNILGIDRPLFERLMAWLEEYEDREEEEGTCEEILRWVEENR